MTSRHRSRARGDEVHAPSADDFLSEIGQIYRPTGRGRVSRDGRSYGWSGDASSISLGYLVGRSQDRVGVSTLKEKKSDEVDRDLLELSLGLSYEYGRRFPSRLSLRNFKIRIPVNGKERSFKAFTCGAVAVAHAVIGERVIRVRCSSSRLRRLTLGLEDPDALRQFIEWMHDR